jgi:hypothetical protein
MTTHVKASIGRTYNTGNYESIRLDVSLEVEVYDDHDINSVQNQLFRKVLDELNEDAQYIGLKKTGP